MHLTHIIKQISLPIFFFSTLILSQNSYAQCTVENTPYFNSLANQGATMGCWQTSGTVIPVKWYGEVLFDKDRVGGTSILISPKVAITNKTWLNYIWSHPVNLFGLGRGYLDSLDVEIKGNSGGWMNIKRYSAPFESKHRKIEDIPLDSVWIGDTIQIRFKYYSGTNPNYLSLESFRLSSYEGDSLYQLPFRESFDGSQWQPDVQVQGSFFHIYAIDTNWRLMPWEHENLDFFKWVTKKDSTKSAYTGPKKDHTTGSGNYMYTEGSNFWNEFADMHTPYIDLSGHSGAKLSFWYHMYGADISTLYIDQLEGNNWHSIDSIVGQQQLASTDDWLPHTVTLDSTGRSQIRFRSKFAWSINKDVAIDDVSIGSYSCSIPNAFKIEFSNYYPNAVDLNWPGDTNSAMYEYEYGTTGFSLGSGILDTTYNPFVTLSNLQSSTSYDVYIRLTCALGDTSFLMGPFSFQTECAAIVAPFLETFNDTIIPSCWLAHNQLDSVNQNAIWKSTNSLGFPAYGAAGQLNHSGNGGFALGVDGSFPFPLDSVALRTPFFDVSQLKDPELRLWLFSNNTNYPGENNTFKIDFFNGTHWLNSALTYEADSPGWVELRLQLDSLNVSGDIRFRFLVDKDSLNAAFYNDIIIDDISIIDGFGLDCDIPDNLQIAQIHCDSATLSWTANPTNNNTRLKIGPLGFDFETAGTWIYNVTSPYTLNGLTKGTDYDVYIVDSCTDGIGINNISFTTNTALLPTISYTKNVLSFTDTSVTYVFDASNTNGGNTFKWDFGNGNIVHGDSVTWTYYTNYSNAVSLDVENSCGVSSTWFTVLVNNIGILETLSQNSSIAIYPNPSHGEFTIELEGLKDEVSDITVFNELGVVIYKQEVKVQSNNTQIELNLSGSKPGLYFLVLQNGKEVKTTQKLLIQ
jgi:hypothetical protein